MNRTTLSSAVLAAAVAAVVGTPLVASAETKIYGRVVAGAVLNDSGEKGEDASWDFGATGLDGSKDNGSRFGFEGSYDLGNGFKTGFKLEQQFAVDAKDSGDDTSGTTTISQRHKLVYLEGAFGRLTLGNQPSPYINAGSWNGSYFTGGTTLTAFRYEGIGYSNSAGPFDFSVLATSNNSDKDIDRLIGSASYDFGPVKLAVGVHNESDDDPMGDDAADRVAASLSGNVGGVGWTVGYQEVEPDEGEDNGSDNIGLFLSYALSDDNLIYLEHENLDSELDNEDYTNVVLGYKHSIGATDLVGEYQTRNNEGDNADPSVLHLGVVVHF